MKIGRRCILLDGFQVSSTCLPLKAWVPKYKNITLNSEEVKMLTLRVIVGQALNSKCKSVTMPGGPSHFKTIQGFITVDLSKLSIGESTLCQCTIELITVMISILSTESVFSKKNSLKSVWKYSLRRKNGLHSRL